MKLNSLPFAAKNCHCRSLWQYDFFVVISTFLLCFFLILTRPVLAGGGTVRIAITPCTDIMKTFMIFQPLALYLQDRIKQPVQLIIPQSFSEFENFVKTNRVDFAYQAPHSYVRLADYYNTQTLLKSLTPEGETRHRGVVIVRRDSPVKTLDDLRGKTVMFGSELSAAKSLAVKILLRQNNIDIDRDLGSYKHDGSCESIALNVFLKSVDAGVICDYSFKDINEEDDQAALKIPADQFRIVAETMEIPTWVFSALKKTDSSVVGKVFKALQELDPEQEQFEFILEKAEIGGFVPASDSDYEKIRNLEEAVL